MLHCRSLLVIYFIYSGVYMGASQVVLGSQVVPTFDPWVGKVSWRRKWQPTPVGFSCLENPMDRGAWRATVHMIAEVKT